MQTGLIKSLTCYSHLCLFSHKNKAIKLTYSTVRHNIVYCLHLVTTKGLKSKEPNQVGLHCNGQRSGNVPW